MQEFARLSPQMFRKLVINTSLMQVSVELQEENNEGKKKSRITLC